MTNKIKKRYLTNEQRELKREIIWQINVLLDEMKEKYGSKRPDNWDMEAKEMKKIFLLSKELDKNSSNRDAEFLKEFRKKNSYKLSVATPEVMLTVQMLLSGYDKKAIKAKTNKTDVAINHITHKFGLKTAPVFNYILQPINEAKKTIYLTNINFYPIAIGSGGSAGNYIMKKGLFELGYILKKKKTIWRKIDIGSLYITGKKKSPALKETTTYGI